jgi:hypothetical protein
VKTPIKKVTNGKSQKYKGGNNKRRQQQRRHKR